MVGTDNKLRNKNMQYEKGKRETENPYERLGTDLSFTWYENPQGKEDKNRSGATRNEELRRIEAVP